MKQITRSMARLDISPEMLESIDTAGILDSFRRDFKKLGDFKQARKKHESRSALSRWWNSDELKDAQLDSIELQESFSQKLGQLMVISVAMSQQLNDQQQSLGQQQEALQKQTKEISAANESIAEQQHDLSKQQDKLKKLIDDYFELKGLTANQAEQLIQIAKEVTTTKERMIASFAQERNTVLAMKEEVETAIFQQQQSFQRLSENQNQRIEDALEEVHRALDKALKQTYQQLEQASISAAELYASAQEKVQAAQVNLTEQVSRQDLSFRKSSEQLDINIQGKLQNAVSSIDAKFIQQQSEMQGALSHQHERTEDRCKEVEQFIQQQASRIGDAEQRLSKQVSRLKWIAATSGGCAGIALLWLSWLHLGN